jgi:hypothetical protein
MDPGVLIWTFLFNLWRIFWQNILVLAPLSGVSKSRSTCEIWIYRGWGCVECGYPNFHFQNAQIFKTSLDLFPYEYLFFVFVLISCFYFNSDTYLKRTFFTTVVPLLKDPSQQRPSLILLSLWGWQYTVSSFNKVSLKQELSLWGGQYTVPSFNKVSLKQELPLWGWRYCILSPSKRQLLF